jgi:hypothetical protein
METSTLINYGLMIVIILIINWLLKDKIKNFFKNSYNTVGDKIPSPRLTNIKLVYRG